MRVLLLLLLLQYPRSQHGSVTQQIQGTSVTVSYNRPVVADCDRRALDLLRHAAVLAAGILQEEQQQQDSHTSSAPSCTRSQRLVSNPPPNPVRSPFDPMTRWQGTMIGIGFFPFAAPTARASFGVPSRRARSP